MAGVDGAAEAVEQMKLKQQEKSKEELVRGLAGAMGCGGRDMRAVPLPPAPSGATRRSGSMHMRLIGTPHQRPPRRHCLPPPPQPPPLLLPPCMRSCTPLTCCDSQVQEAEREARKKAKAAEKAAKEAAKAARVRPARLPPPLLALPCAWCCGLPLHRAVPLCLRAWQQPQAASPTRCLPAGGAARPEAGGGDGARGRRPAGRPLRRHGAGAEPGEGGGWRRGGGQGALWVFGKLTMKGIRRMGRRDVGAWRPQAGRHGKRATDVAPPGAPGRRRCRARAGGCGATWAPSRPTAWGRACWCARACTTCAARARAASWCCARPPPRCRRRCSWTTRPSARRAAADGCSDGGGDGGSLALVHAAAPAGCNSAVFSDAVWVPIAPAPPPVIPHCLPAGHGQVCLRPAARVDCGCGGHAGGARGAHRGLLAVAGRGERLGAGGARQQGRPGRPGMGRASQSECTCSDASLTAHASHQPSPRPCLPPGGAASHLHPLRQPLGGAALRGGLAGEWGRLPLAGKVFVPCMDRW